MIDSFSKGKGFNSKEDFETWKKETSGYYHGSFSKNRNPTATRGKRQTYQDRDYAGKVGDFLPEEKVLIRYNVNNLFDKNFIDGLLKDIEAIENEIIEFDNETLEIGKAVAEQALQRFTPIDTGNLMAHWKVWVDYNTQRVEMENDCEYAVLQNYGSEGHTTGPDGFHKVAWYPGYWMLEKAQHRVAIAMREFARAKQLQLRSEVESGN